MYEVKNYCRSHKHRSHSTTAARDWSGTNNLTLRVKNHQNAFVENAYLHT